MSSLSSLKNAFSAKKNFTQRANVVNNSISNEIEINSTKKKTIGTINANKKTRTTTTKNITQTSKTKMTMTNTRFISSSILIFWRLWTSCLAKLFIKFWTRFAFSITYEIGRRLSRTRSFRNSFVWMISTNRQRRLNKILWE